MDSALELLCLAASFVQDEKKGTDKSQGYPNVSHRCSGDVTSADRHVALRSDAPDTKHNEYSRSQQSRLGQRQSISQSPLITNNHRRRSYNGSPPPYDIARKSVRTCIEPYPTSTLNSRQQSTAVDCIERLSSDLKSPTVEDHFLRSLGEQYNESFDKPCDAHSVDEHFSKALGSYWKTLQSQLKNADG